MNVVVLGAGPAGMTAGRVLASKGATVTVVERCGFVGGAAASQPAGATGARMDFGPHAFHLKNPEVNKFLFDYAGSACPVKTRNERILIRDRLFRYPLEITEVLRYLSPLHIFAMGVGFAGARLRFRTFPRPDHNFESWGVNRFGRSLYEFSCGSYTEKVWGVHPSTLSAKLAKQKLKDLRLRDIAAKLIGGRGQEHKKYWENYVYPEKGIGTVFENMGTAIERDSGRVICSAPLHRVLADENKVRGVTVMRDGREEEIACDALVSSIPLTHLGAALAAGDAGIRIPDAEGLRYRGLILVNVEFERESITPYDWVYLLDEIYRCNRFTEQKNMGGAMMPAEKTVLCFELAASPGDATWNMPDQQLFDIVLEDIRKIPFIDESSIRAFHIARLQDAYPMYTLDFDGRLARIIERLAQTKNLITFGRQGLYLNTDVHDSMEMGMRAANNIAGGTDIPAWYQYAEEYLQGKIGF